MEGQKDWRVQPEHSGNLIRLQNLIRRAAGFRLLILQQNRPRYRDGLIAFLGESQPDSRVMNLKELGGFEAFESELEKGGKGRILHLINLESLGKKEQQAFFKGLNYHREYIARTCSGILAFWLPDPLVREMALQAADFWAWREQVLDFTFHDEEPERFLNFLGDTVNIDAPMKQERICEIEAFLDNSSCQSSLTTADLKRELGLLYWSTGQHSQAQTMLESAIAEYRELDEAEARAFSQRDLAGLLTLQGQSEKALNILKDQVLPVFQGLSNEREQAETFGKIADILQSHNQFTEALNIREEKQLPVYERLGDKRSRALTIGKIADVLQECGEYDEALRIREVELLPVYESLGDIRSKAVTMGQIADILQVRGLFNEALRIYKQEALPIHERLGDVLATAVTKGYIADILRFQGKYEDALQIYENILPIFEELGVIRSLLVGRIKLLILLKKMDERSNKSRIEELLRLILTDIQKLKLPHETEWIENIMKDMQIKP